MKSIKVKEVTPLTDHESTMGRGGIFKVKIAQGNGIYEATEIPVKTWDETAITTVSYTHLTLPTICSV